MSTPSEACHTTGEGEAPSAAPWAGDPRADAKDALLTYVVENPAGVRPLAAARSVLSSDPSAGDADHQLALRVFDGHPDLFRTARQSGLRWVEPTSEAVSLKRRMESVGTQDCVDLGDDTEKTPAERVKEMLGEVRRVDSDGFRAVLVREFARHKRLTEDTYTVVGDSSTGEVLAMEIGDRYTDPREVAGIRVSAEEVADELSRRFEVLVMVTLTVPRGCIDSVASSAEQLRAWKNKLHDRLAYNPKGDEYATRPGRVPPNAVFLQQHEDAVAHLHVVYGGVSRLMDWRALRALWADVIGAEGPVQADIRSLSVRGDRWPVRRGKEVPEEYGDMREYLLSSVRDLGRLARTGSEELDRAANRLERGEGREADRDLAGLAMFWASSATLVSCSGSLRPSSAPSARSSESGRSRWTYLGTWSYDTMPRYLRQRAVFVRRGGAWGEPPSGG